MSRPTRLSDADIAAAVDAGPLKFELHDGQLVRVVSCTSFGAALEFVNAVGAIAERYDHHPDIDIRYSTVVLFLSTHDVGGLSERDFEVARAIDALAVG